MFFRQSAAAEEHILNARRRRISESQFEVEFIILRKQRTVNDVAQLVLMLLPIIHRFLHGDFFELSRKSAIGRNLIFFFQHRTDNRAVFLIYRPYKRRTGIFSHPRIGSIKDVMIARHVAGHIQQRDAFCASPDIPTHGVCPQLKRRAGGRVRALGVDHHLVVKTIFVQGGSRLQKRAPRLPVGGDLVRGLRGKLYIIVNFGHFIAPPSLSQHNAQARSAGFIQLHHDRTVILLARLGNHALD